MRSRKAIANLKSFCDREPAGEIGIEIIDVAEFPEIAEAEKILITPTLIRKFPQPEERIIGDLSNSKVLAFALNLPSQSC